jgi:TetR/AcrR family transcriptional regulator, mexJK operon transcriptional repressor
MTIPLKSRAARGRPGRPSLKRVSEIDQAVLDAARELFFAEGFDAVTMEGVAELAGISKGTLYARYDSKDLLFTAVVNSVIAKLSERASRNNHLLTGSIRQRLIHHARSIAESTALPEGQALFRLFMSLPDRLSDRIGAVHQVHYGLGVTLIAEEMRQAAAREGLTIADPTFNGKLMVSAIPIYYLKHAHLPDAQDRTFRFAEQLVDLIVSQWPGSRD